MKKALSPDSSCPCGSGLSYGRCCGALHAGAPAPDARALMASRYSAYALGLEVYLRDTWAPEKRPQRLDLESDGIKWLGLRIRSFKETGEDRAEVEYVARGRVGGGAGFRLHEKARFERRQGRWLYVDGDLLP